MWLDVPDHISLWGLRLAICQTFQQYANVRPTKVFRGTQSPLRKCGAGDLDWVIVRENSEGEYAGQGGRSHRGFPWEVATEVSIFSRHAVERILKFAFETAQKRPRKKLTVVTKSNAQRNGMVMWDEVASEVSKDFPDVAMDKMLVDAMTVRMVMKPDSLDTIVATNLVRHCHPLRLAQNKTDLHYSMLISFPTSLLLSRVPSVSHPHLTLIPPVRTQACSSLFMAQHSTSPAWASRIQWALSGPHVRCWAGSAKKAQVRCFWTP